MKKVLFIIAFLLLSFGISNACDYEFSSFGDVKKSISTKSGIEPTTFPDKFGAESLSIPMIDICEDKDFWDTKLEYFYINNKLVRIELLRVQQNDRKLMDHVMRKYGKFNLPVNIEKNKWRGVNEWEKGNEIIQFAVIDIPGGHAEVLRIMNKLYFNDLSDYYEKVGEWEDSTQN